MVKGSLIHLGLAQHYSQLREEQEGRDPKTYFDPLEAIDLMVEAKPDWKEHGDLAKRVIEAYLIQWRNERFKVVAVEELLEEDPIEEFDLIFLNVSKGKFCLTNFGI